MVVGLSVESVYGLGMVRSATPPAIRELQLPDSSQLATEELHPSKPAV